MKVTALVPDGFRTDQASNRQAIQISLQRRSFSKIHFLAFISRYRIPSAVWHGPIQVRKPSGLRLPFEFKARIAGGPSVWSYKTHGCLRNRSSGPRLQHRGD